MIPLKKQSHIIKFDIVSFYRSISRNVLNEAIQFARNYHNINDDMINTIMNSRKAFLFYDGNPWVKKDTLQHFDVTEHSFDGAEICELVGLYLLNQLKDLITNGSVVIRSLCTNKFYPYRKPNDTPFYVHCESNHPLNILKQLPKMTSELYY